MAQSRTQHPNARLTPRQRQRMVDQLLVASWGVTVAAQRFHAGPKTVHNWRRAFVEAGRGGLARGRRRWSSRELEFEAVLGEAQV